MKKFILAAVAMTAFSVVSSAAVVTGLTPCSRVSSFGAISSTDFTGCQLGDKQFTNFGKVSGTAAAIPDNWAVSIFQEGDVYVVDFSQGAFGDKLTFPNGPWGVSYDVQVDTDMCPNCVISNVGVSINPGAFGAGSVLKVVKNAAGAIIGSAVASSPGSSPNSFALVPPSTWIHVEEVVTLTGSRSVLSSFTDAFVQSTVAPEPATYGMMGLGLAALGLVSRRKKA